MSGFANGPFNGPYPPGYSQDAWVVKVDSMGCVVPGCDGVGVTEIITNLNDALTVYPNPAHGQVQVGIQLPQHLLGTDLHLSIVAADGRLVRREEWPKSKTTGTLDIHALSPGPYTLHVTDGSRWITGTKLMIE